MEDGNQTRFCRAKNVDALSIAAELITNTTMSTPPQTSDGDVDGKGKNGSASRARAQHEVEAHVAATRVENDLRLTDSASVRDIILAHPRVRVLLVATAVRSLSAQRFYFDKAAGGMVHEDDANTQMKAVAWLAAYSDGLPVMTNLNVNANAGGGRVQNPDEMLAGSPALIAALERTLERARKMNAQKHEPKMVEAPA